MVQSIFDVIRPQVFQGITYTSGKSHAQVQGKHRAARTIKLSSNECPYLSSLAVRKAIEHAAQYIHLYPDAYAKKLTTALAYKHNVAPEQVVLANGSCEILELLVLLVCQEQRNDAMLVGKHTFELYGLLARNFGIDYIEIPLHDWVIDLNAMQQNITHNTRMICLANPSNPTGTVVDNIHLLAFVQQVPPTTLVVIDQAYADFAPKSEHANEQLLRFPNVVITRTFSKAYGLAGLRLGYAIAHPTVIDNINKLRQPFNTNTLAQHAAVAALDDVDTLTKTLQNNQEQKKVFYEFCQRFEIDFLPSQANFITIDVGCEKKAKHIEQGLLDQGIIIRSLASYGLSRMLRITIGTPQQMCFFYQAWQELMCAPSAPSL